MGVKLCVYLFQVFVFAAAALHWTKGFWSLLLQCQLVGKAAEVCMILLEMLSFMPVHETTVQQVKFLTSMHFMNQYLWTMDR